MWKYVSRRIRDTFERSANYFDVRSTTGISNTPTNNINSNEKKDSSSLCRWYCAKKCWNSFRGNDNTKNSRWNFEHLNNSWLGAITWSGGLVLGWYASQMINLKYKYRQHENSQRKINNVFCSLKPYVKCSPTFPNKQHFFKITPNKPTEIKLITNDVSGSKARRTRVESGSTTSADSSDKDLSDVLNSIENRLGLSAIESGQHQDGLNLLRSAALRNHAPALYNLGLCYELGLGVKPDEKMAMELYRTAATLEHPGALYNLSIYYGQGRGGLARDTDTATRLLRLAAVKGQEEAIKALEILDIPPVEEKKLIPEKWTYSYVPYTSDETIVPTQSSLFVNNVMPFMQLHNCEATVY